MRVRAMAALAMAAFPAAFASAGEVSNLITSVQMIAPAPTTQPVEGVGFFEDFEGFALGGAGQFGWLTNTGTIVNSGVGGFGSRTASANVAAGAVGFVASPDFGASSFGLIAADLVATVDDGTTYGFETDHIDSGTINTRVLFQPGGGIDVVQIVAGAGAVISTSGSWAAGVSTQIGIEVLAGNMLNVYQDGSLIFSGHDIVQELAVGAGGLDRIVGGNFGGGNGSLLIDNITDQLIPAPGALALFGMAGFAATRRRR